MLEIKRKKSPKSVFWEEVFIAKLPREDTLKDNLSGNFRRIFTFSRIGQFQESPSPASYVFFQKEWKRCNLKIFQWFWKCSFSWGGDHFARSVFMLYNPNVDFFSFLRILRSTAQEIHKRFWWRGTFAPDHSQYFWGWAGLFFSSRAGAVLKIFRGVTTIRAPAVLTKRRMQKRVKCRYFAYSHRRNIKLVFSGQHQIILLWQKVKKVWRWNWSLEIRPMQKNMQNFCDFLIQSKDWSEERKRSEGINLVRFQLTS